MGVSVSLLIWGLVYRETFREFLDEPEVRSISVQDKFGTKPLGSQAGLSPAHLATRSNSSTVRYFSIRKTARKTVETTGEFLFAIDSQVENGYF